jgi:decaprenylphospho-beta-D-erythro-pentofuranosid-2-ulose 2-reductase
LIHFDATATAGHARFVEELAQKMGDLDVVVVAFGLLGDQPVDEQGGDGAVAVALTNYVGAVSVCLPLARVLRAQGHGTLVILSSVAGERVRRANFIYGSSKAGLDGFAQGLADSMADSGASVLIVRPGFVPTKMTARMRPAPFSSSPEEVGGAVAAAIASGKDIVYVPGYLRFFMRLVRHLPRRLFRLIKR